MLKLPLRTVWAITTIAVLVLSTAGFVSAAETEKNGKEQSLFHLVKNKNYTEASSRLETLYKAYPNSVSDENRLLSEVGTAVVHLPKEHEQELREFLKLNRDSVAAKFLGALFFQQKGRNARGGDNIDKTSREKVDNMRSALVNTLSRFQAVLEKDPGNFMAHMYSAENYAFLGNSEAKEREYRAALAIDPDSYRIWGSYIFFNTPRWGGSYKKMEDLIQEMAQHEQSNPTLRRLKGMMLGDKADTAIRNKKLDEAEALVFKALEFGKVPYFPNLVGNLFFHIEATGEMDRKCRVAKKVIAIAPKAKYYKNVLTSCS